MTVTSPTLHTFFFIFLVAVAAESGSGSGGASLGCGTCTDAELDNSFECVTQMPTFKKHFLICNATVAETNLNEADINITVAYQKQFRTCVKVSRLVSNCSLQSDDLISPVEVCLVMMTLMNQQYKDCRMVKAIKIIKPEAPFGLNITYQEQANEYFVQFSTPYLPGPSYLDGKLMHELAYRQENKPWTVTDSNYVTLKLLGKQFQPGETYEMKVRSKPNGDYFDGTWSEWSASKYFKTATTVPNEINDNTVKIIIILLAFAVVFILISLITIFWKSRIKPAVWPTIPNHEKTLDKFCHKLRKNSDASFFNPESFEYVHIHKVDSIQSKPEMERFQTSPLPWDADVLEKIGNGTEQKNNLKHINHGWLKLPLAYEGMWPAEMHLGRSTQTSNAVISASLCDDRSTSGQHGCSDALGDGSTPSMGPTILSGLEADPCRQVYTNSETKVSNIEEAYVTMASFFGSKGNLGK